ncbi:MAG: Stealth CR1 domain-containing protein [Alphaproteobacteria bacterium]
MSPHKSQEANLSGIDFVVTWVDSSDPKWRKDFEKHKLGEPAMGLYRDMGTLQYLFRSFELFTPWVRKIHFVTCGHTPSWLDVKHPKINIVRHADILPKDALPTFNSGAIDMAIGNIEGLCERFVYFDDDMFMIKPTAEERFFLKGLPKDFFQVRILFQDKLYSHRIHEQMALIARSFRCKDVFTWRMIPKVFNWRYGIVANVRTFLSLIVSKTLSSIALYHHPTPYLMINIQEAYREFPDEISKTQRQKFREYDSISDNIFRFWGLINGRFVPSGARDAFYKTISSMTDIDDGIRQAGKRRYRFVCFNDSDTLSDAEFSYFKERVGEFLHELFPEPSSFELRDQNYHRA